MPTKTRRTVVTPGDSFDLLFEGNPDLKMCAGTIQVSGGTIEFGYLGSDTVYADLPSLSSWDINGLDLTGITVRQKTAGGSGVVRFQGTVHA